MQNVLRRTYDSSASKAVVLTSYAGANGNVTRAVHGSQILLNFRNQPRLGFVTPLQIRVNSVSIVAGSEPARRVYVDHVCISLCFARVDLCSDIVRVVAAERT